MGGKTSFLRLLQTQLSSDFLDQRNNMKATPSAAATVFPKMDTELQQAFYTCVQNYGKISTKKLLASFIEPRAIRVADKVIALAEYPGVPSRQDVPIQASPSKDTDLSWLTSLPKGPGVSPCVINTCERLLEQTSDDTHIDTLAFVEALCRTALQLKKLVQQHKVDVSSMIAQAREECVD